MQLIHFGSARYDPLKFNQISDIPFRNKPHGGLWTSPVDSKYGWREWCEYESFGELNNFFQVQFNGTVLKIDSAEDMEKLSWIECDNMHFVSFQTLCGIEFIYDAIHLTVNGEKKTRDSRPKSLYGWDCESVLVMNPKSIKAV